MILTLHLLALVLYGLATALALAPFVGLPAAPRAATIALPCAGAALHVVALSQLTLVGLGPALSMLALCLVLLFVTGYVGDGETGDLVGYELLRKPFTVGALANAVAVALTRRPNEPRRSGGAAAAG